MKLRELWKSWEDFYNSKGIEKTHICKDGFINIKEYMQARKKILFVLKDVNDYPGGDLADLLKEGPKYQMWHTIARWAAGILNDFPKYELIDNYDIMKKSLLQVAAINLKKISGMSYADMRIINAFSKQDKHLLVKQIEIVNPQIIIACGTFDSLIWILDLDVNPFELDKKGVIKDKWLVIQWRHPGRANNKKTFENLRKLMKN